MIAIRHTLILMSLLTVALLELTPSDILAFSALIAAGVATWAVARRKELRAAFEDRGEVIDDLHRKCDDMERDMAELRGELKSTNAIKAKEIALEVARLIRQPGGTRGYDQREGVEG